MVLKYANIINSATGECLVSDIQHADMKNKKDVTLSEIDNKWYLTSHLENDRAYQLQVLAKRKQEKYKALTNNYDYACKYGICESEFQNKTLYSNRAWLGTWSEAITGLEYQQVISESPATAFVRLYEKVGDKFKNITINDVTLDQYKALYLELINYRFNTLQANRNSRYMALEQAETIQEVESISEDFGTCIDEQNDYNNLIIN